MASITRMRLVITEPTRSVDLVNPIAERDQQNEVNRAAISPMKGHFAAEMEEGRICIMPWILPVFSLLGEFAFILTEAASQKEYTFQVKVHSRMTERIVIRRWWHLLRVKVFVGSRDSLSFPPWHMSMVLLLARL